VHHHDAEAGANPHFEKKTKDYEASLASLIFLPPSAAVASDGTPQPDQKKNRLSMSSYTSGSSSDPNNNNSCNNYDSLSEFSEQMP
jgi:hypothetical protein